MKGFGPDSLSNQIIIRLSIYCAVLAPLLPLTRLIKFGVQSLGTAADKKVTNCTGT